jgi:hypothetical protein
MFSEPAVLLPSDGGPTVAASVVTACATAKQVGSTTIVASVITVGATAKQKERKENAEKKAERIKQLGRIIDNHSDWSNPDNYIIEDNTLKSLLGFDPAAFSAAQLRIICSKLGFSARKFKRDECIASITTAVLNRKQYDDMDPQSNTEVDSGSLRCRLLNVIFSDKFWQRLTFLGARKSMPEIDEGDAGKDKLFWKDVAYDFNDYGSELETYGLLIVTSSADVKIFEEKKIDPSRKSTKVHLWDDLRKMYLAIQDDYKKKI